MDRAREFGLSDLSLEPGDHICAIYLSHRERDEVMLPFIREGLRGGDKCICILDSVSPLELLVGVGEGIDAGGYMASQQLEIASSGETYFRSGRFSSREVVAYLDHSVGAATRDGRFPFARVICELPRPPGDSLQEEDLFRHESELDRFAHRYPQAILCLYDISHFGGGIVLELLKVHHKMLFGDLVFEAPP